jgi:EF hand
MNRILVALGMLLIAVPATAAPPAPERTEFQLMWDAILGGSDMGPGDGWFKPAQARYTWSRFQARFDRDKNGRVTPKEFDGPPALFAALDRDGDGAITADDLDWSENAPYFRQLGIAQQLLRQGDTNGNKKLSKEEWSALFERAAKGQDSLDAEALRKLLFPPAPPQSKGSGGMPPKAILLLGLLKGEVGSASEGPKLEAPAPDFTLSSPDGKTSITMSDSRGKKPVVLIFGSFT